VSSREPLAVGSVDVRIGRIAYLNVAPVYYGFDRGLTMPGLTWQQGPPAVLNRMMAAGEIDIGPISSAAYARFQDDWLILPDLSISCCGAIMSVLLVSRFPFEDLDGKRVLLTDESASGAALLKLLAANKGIVPHYSVGHIDSPSKLDRSADAALVIGDTALRNDWETVFPFVLDLGDLWYRSTALPFVFALWTVRKAYARQYPETVAKVCRLLKDSRRSGLRALDDICNREAESTDFSADFLKNYFSKFSYNLDKDRQEGLQRFYDDLYKQGIVDRPVVLSFFE
jgi:chorismate dehydratase